MGLVIPDTGLLFWMVLSFAITFWILAKFAWKPILKTLKNREENIENSINQAKDAREEMEKLKAENLQILAQARSERDLLLQEAADLREKMIQKAEVDAKEKTEKMLNEAHLLIENEKQKALAEIKSKVVELSIEISQKVLQRELQNKEAQKDFINTLADNAKFN
jgi:F-type H+-transporting ATPase subunit b